MYKRSQLLVLLLTNLKYGERRVVVGEIILMHLVDMLVVGKRYLKARVYMLL
jgi:hypothetical protein